MNINRRAVLLAAGGLVSSPSFAQSYPDRPVKIIVPYAPGGTTDIFARVIASKLALLLGQPFIVDNRAGTGGAIGTALAAKAPLDGYTLVMLVESSHAVNPSVSLKLGYDPIADFAPISNIADVPNVFVVGERLRSKDMAGVISALKAEPNKYAFGSSGAGGLSNINGELFKYITGTKALHVPYRGMAPALGDIVAGQIDFGIDNIPSSIGLIEGGQLKALAVANKTRLKKLPGVPTFAELGMPALNHPSWFGLGAPAGVAPSILDRLNGAVTQALEDPNVIAQIERLGAAPAPTSRAEFTAFVKSELARWRAVIADTKIEKI